MRAAHERPSYTIPSAAARQRACALEFIEQTAEMLKFSWIDPTPKANRMANFRWPDQNDTRSGRCSSCKPQGKTWTTFGLDLEKAGIPVRFRPLPPTNPSIHRRCTTTRRHTLIGIIGGTGAVSQIVEMYACVVFKIRQFAFEKGGRFARFRMGQIPNALLCCWVAGWKRAPKAKEIRKVIQLDSGRLPLIVLPERHQRM